MSEPPKRRLLKRPTGGQVRPPVARLDSGKTRSASSRAWLERQLADPFVAQARAKGYRSRAALKLVEIDDRYHLIPRGGRVIDLGCAPGGWLQVALERGASSVVGIDLLAVEPVAGARIVQGDLTEDGVGAFLVEQLGSRPDLVLCDMAPNTTGHRQTDHLRIMALVEAAAEFAISTLRPGGNFFSKAFQGGETAAVIARLRRGFADVRTIKPRASRAESSEVYLAALGFRGR